jgi:hypothetical protein
MSNDTPSELPPPAAGGETPAPPADSTDARPQYEFDPAQNEVINNLAVAMIWVRVPLLIVGVFQALIAVGLAFRVPKDGAHIVGVLSHGVAALICFLLANWLFKASYAFAQVTTTTGRDITYLMNGLRSLGSWFDLLAFFVKVYVFLLVVLLVILLFGLLGGAFRGTAG